MLNEANLIGRVGKKSYKNLSNGNAMVTLYVATRKKWKDNNGEKQEQTTWHNVNFFSKLAELCDQYVDVGSLLFIKGEINNKQITHGEKQGQWAYSVTGHDFKILSYAANKDKKSSKKESEDYSGDDLNDDIPF